MSAVVTPQLEDFFDVYIEWTDDLPLQSEEQVNAEVKDVPIGINATAENITLAQADILVAVETPADDHADEPPSTDSGTPDNADTSPDDDEAKYQRFCAMAEQIVPDKRMWPLVYKPPTDFFDAEDLPFDEKTYLYCPANGGYWGSFSKSIVYPYVCSMVAILGSTLTIFTFLSKASVNCVDSSANAFVLFIMVWELASASLIVLFLDNNQAWLLLYYRLWEQKTIIEFKTKRTLFNKHAVILVMITAILEFGYGWFSPRVTDKLAYTFVIASPTFTRAQVVYSSFDFENRLISYSMAYRHFLDKARSDGLKPFDEDEARLKCRDKMQRIAQQIKFFSKSKVKYDIMALSRYASKVLAKKFKAAKAKTMVEPARSAALAVCEEEKQWIRVLGMWIGRLGNTKALVQEKWGDIEWLGHDYLVFVFVYYNGVCELWHSHGSFKALPITRGRPTRSGSVPLYRVLQVYGLFQSPKKC